LSNDEKKKAKDTRLLSKTYSSFIDILFAVVLGQSFILLTSKDYYSTWFAKPYANAFGLFTLLLIYGLITSSWVGYHQSIKNYPLQSVWRFLIDVTLLFLYYFAFANAGNFSVVLLTITACFSAYVAWDIFRIYENRSFLGNHSKKMDLFKRLGWSAIFLGFYVLVYFLYDYASPLIGGIDWLFLAIAMALLIAYRYVKWYRSAPPSLETLQNHQPKVDKDMNQPTT
jgi:succinate dehydrogenase hydrophobic anchor subunit